MTFLLLLIILFIVIVFWVTKLKVKSIKISPKMACYMRYNCDNLNSSNRSSSLYQCA